MAVILTSLFDFQGAKSRLKTLKAFVEKHPDAKGPLDAWYEMATLASWKKPIDVKSDDGSASIIADNRVVFNIKGNDYRLVVKIHYNTGFVYVRFVGTHAEYDKIDAETI